MGSKVTLSLVASYFVIDTRRNPKGFHGLHNRRPIGPFDDKAAYAMAAKLNDFVERNGHDGSGPFRVICDWTEQTR